jgi:hypothetical protein
MIFGNQQQQRIAELEEQNRQWQLYYQTQMLPPTLTPPVPPKAKKKAKKAGNKVNPNPLSMEVKIWILIGILSFFALIIVKNWLTDATTTPPERVEKRKK